MKSLLLIALCDINDLSNGVTLKVRAQIGALKKMSYQVTTATYDFHQIIIQNEAYTLTKESKSRRKDLFKEVLRFIESNKVDICFIRFAHFDIRFMRILKKLKKKNVNIYLEIPSYPIKYPKKSLAARYFQFFDFMHQHQIKKYVNQILAVGSPSEKIFGVKNQTIPNGYMQETKKTDIYNCNEDQIDILSMSSFYDIHGLDRLVEGYKLYVKNPSSTKIYIHLVGDGPCKADLIKRVDDYQLSDYIKFYPSMSQTELSELYKIVNMGCAPLAIHRTNYKYASPLKTKDYFQRGLPYFCAYEEIGIDSNYPYVLKYPLDDTPIDFHQLVTFYKTYQSKCELVQQEMKTYGEAHFNWEYILSIIQ